MPGALPIICGPTAAGKSAVAMRLAQHGDAVLIGADSRQVYRGFDIGTAKPTAADRSRVPHRGLDVVEPSDQYSAARWAAAAAGWVADAVDAGRVPLIVGGTGLYLRALATPLFEEPPLDGGRRAALRLMLDDWTSAELRRWCDRLDPARAHLGRTQLARAVEIALLTGRPLSEWHRRAPRAERRDVRYLVVDPGPTLGASIAARAATMLSGGWQDEVRRLIDEVPVDAPAWKATGYRTVRDLVAGRIGHPAALHRIVVETRQYAKRQRTWFRHQLPADAVTRVSPEDPDFEATVDRWWEEVSGR